MKKCLINFSFSIALISIIFIACNHSKKELNKQDALVAHIDSSIKAGDDFFLFANGSWFEKNPIPADKGSNGIFQLIQDTINAQVRHICELSAASKNVEKGSNKQKIGDFFSSGMDSAYLNKKGISDIKEYIEMIDKINDLNSFTKVTSYIYTIAASPLFDLFISPDDKISCKNAIFIYQGGLSLPDRNYYIDNDSRTVSVRKQFISYLKNMYQILGYNETEASTAAKNTMKLETAIAKASRKTEDTRDPIKNYNKISFSQLKESTPNFDWNLFMNGLGLHNIDTVIIGQPEFLKTLNTYIKTYPLKDWKNYLKFQLINSLAEYLDDKTYIESFNFNATALYGIKQPKPRWERVVQKTNGFLGELIGQVYVKEYMPEGTKEKLLEIGNAIKKVYAERIKALDWMSMETKKKALKKLEAVNMKLGYPDKWKDLSKMEISRNSYVQNVINANKWEVDYMVSKYGKPVDRSEWHMQPQTYNAYYSSSNNEIVIPGCNIIVPGYENTIADDAILYAIIGATFGHEIIHGFDDQGSKYDEFGNLNNWWLLEDSIKFYSKTKMIVKQFNDYIAVDSLHINGELTLGENIADLAGVTIAYEAFKKTSQYINNKTIAGYNPSQRFFLGYALAWMLNERPETIVNRVKSDVHSPVKFRVIGPLSNISEFYTAFNVKKGDAMWRPDSLKIKIW